MRLLQWNLKLSFKLAAQYIAIGLTLGYLYHTRMGYELTTPAPLPEQNPAPEVRRGLKPQICVGVNSDEPTFGYTKEQCPKHHAIYANSDVPGAHKTGPGRYVQLTGLCCPLPSDDILTDEHLYFEQETCPDQYVATGAGGDCEDKCTMRCTKINTKRYKLGPEKVAYYVKFADAGRLFGQGRTKRVFWENLPQALRYGINRTKHDLWASDGCLGVSLGSLLTRKNQKRCDGFFYRELQYLDGVPVKMFPDCEAISDLYSAKPQCLDAKRAGEAIKAVIRR